MLKGPGSGRGGSGGDVGLTALGEVALDLELDAFAALLLLPDAFDADDDLKASPLPRDRLPLETIGEVIDEPEAPGGVELPPMDDLFFLSLFGVGGTMLAKTSSH